MSDEPTLPICVDCDGTLLRTNLLHEALLALMRQSYLALFLIPLWLLRGKAFMKEQLARRVTPVLAQLPSNEALIAYLRQARARGHSLVLATATPSAWAEKLAQHLALFDRVEASRDGIDLSGERKAQRLCELYGEGGFLYAGSSRADLAVWRRAAGAIVVNAPQEVLARLGRTPPIVARFDDARAGLRDYVQAMRLHQWLKNLLVFVPALAAHRILEPVILLQSLLAFLAFGLCASSVYVLNDLVDLPYDRAHPSKRRRPFASGRLAIAQGMGLIPLLVLPGAALGFRLGERFVLVLTAYYAITLAYTFWLKDRTIVDVLALAVLYTLRLLAGAAATAIVPSFWLLALSMFLFLSLALVKRYSELALMLAEEKQSAAGRGYHVSDLSLLASLGSSSGHMAVLVMALYLNSADVHVLYVFPEALWLLPPLLLYWISRVWMKTHRGQMHEDPVVFALRDRVSLLTILASGMVLLVATLGWPPLSWPGGD